MARTTGPSPLSTMRVGSISSLMVYTMGDCFPPTMMLTVKDEPTAIGPCSFLCAVATPGSHFSTVEKSFK